MEDKEGAQVHCPRSNTKEIVEEGYSGGQGEEKYRTVEPGHVNDPVSKTDDRW